MHFTSAELSAWVGSFLWPLFRVGAMVGVAPVFGLRAIPMRVRVGLAAALTLLIAPLLPPMPALDPLSLPGVAVVVQQLAIGLALGFVLRLVFAVFEVVGEVIGHLKGLGFASMVDPQNGVPVPVISQFYLMLATLMFLALGGHLAWIEVLAESFRVLPVGPAGLTREAAWQLAAFGSQMFAWALRLALPVVAALLVVNLAFGILTRAAPQLNLFSVGFPVSMLLGFLLVGLTLPAVLAKVEPLALEGLARAAVVFGGGR